VPKKDINNLLYNREDNVDVVIDMVDMVKPPDAQKDVIKIENRYVVVHGEIVYGELYTGEEQSGDSQKNR
jgi:hypothetical protein